MKINSLVNFRYSITGMNNDAFASFLPATRVPLTVTMSATYAKLIQFHLIRLHKETGSALAVQITRNHMTALRGLLHSLEKTQSSPIGVEMTTEHIPAVKHYLSSLTVSDRSKSDRRSLLNAWRLSFELMGVAPEATIRGRERRSANSTPLEQNPFEAGLKLALRRAGLSPKRAALLAGVSTSALGRWARGALPNLRSVTNLEKLDTVLNVPIGHMRELLQKAINRCAPAQNNEYRDRLRVRCADPYKLKPAQLNEQFKLEWASLMKHKCTTGAGSKQRHANGRWSVTGNENAKEAIAGITTFEGKHFASAGILWAHLSAFFGFLHRPKSDGGWGLTHEVVQSLGWLADSEAIDAFLDFRTKRSAGLIHKGHAVFCTNIASLTHPEHGFLTQTPEMMDRLPHARTEGRSWREHCEAARHTAGSWKSASVDVSRDPAQPIRFLLDQPHPLLPVFTAMQRLREIGNAAPAGSKSEACARRDELLLGILLSNPLRRKNIIELTVSPDNGGSVYQTASGEWRIRLSRSAFKNGKTATRKARTYDVRLAPWLAPLMSDYVTHFRPVLGDHSILGPLFLSKNGGPLLDMTHRVLILTRQLIPGCGGFGPHAFRHLVATDWLRRNPNDFLTVAHLLNDSLEVVLETYAHLKQDDALTRHSDQLADLMPTYLKPKS